MKRAPITIIIVCILIGLIFSGCAQPTPLLQAGPQFSATMQELEGRVAKLEQPQPTQAVDALVQQQSELTMRVGELATRIAKEDFIKYGGEAKGLVSFGAALQTALTGIHHEEGQPYIIQDVEFIPNFKTQDPQSPVGEAWRLLIHSPNLEHFYVAVDAKSGQVFFTNEYQ